MAAGTTPSGTVVSLSVVKRPNGTTQVTYKGMPLYKFAHDHSPGEANRQAVKDVGAWSAVRERRSRRSPRAEHLVILLGGGGGGGYGY